VKVEIASFSKKYMTVIDALIDILRTPDIESAMSTLTDWAKAAVSVTMPPPSLFMLSTQRNEFVGVFGQKQELTKPVNHKLPKTAMLLENETT
jgi:hypothetical protein